MPITRSTDLTNSAVTNYQKTFLDLSIQRRETWGQFVDWQEAVADDGGFGGTRDYPAFGELDPVETPLVEDADVIPDSITDYNVTVAPGEYGRAVARTQVAAFMSRVRLQERMARMVANDRINSIDRLIRRSVCGYGSSAPTYVVQPDGTTTMANLAAQNAAHRVSWSFLSELRLYAKVAGIEPVDRAGNLVAVVHPLLEYDLINLTEFQNARYYRSDDTTIFQGEIGQVAGIRFIVSNAGRVHLGAGADTATSASTTLAAPASAGATTIIVASGANIANGDYLTIGTIETGSVAPSANLEQVQVLSGGGTPTLTIRGMGNGTSFGLRFDHAAGEAVEEQANICSIPLLGRNSLIGMYGARTGRYGQAIIKTGLDILDRIAYFGWYWYGGVARVEKQIILGRVAVSKWMIGYN